MIRRMVLFIAWLLIGADAALASTDSFFQDLENIKAKSPALQTEIERARALNDVALARSFFWTPKLTASAGTQSQQVNEGPTAEANALKASASWNLFRGLSEARAKEAAGFAASAQERKIESDRLKLEVRAADLLFRRLYLEDEVRNAREQVSLSEKSRKVVAERFQQGRISRQELTKAEIDKSKQENRLRSLEIEQLENRASIGALLVSEIKTAAWPFSPEQRLPAVAGDKRNPETETYRLLARSAEAAWKSRRGLYWPSLDFTVDYSVSPIREGSVRQLSSGLTLTIPLWSQYDTVAETSRAYAEFVSARGDVLLQEATEDASRSILEKKVETSRQNLVEARANLEKSQSLYADMFKAFQLGRMTVNDLLVEQTRLIDIELSVSQSQLAYHKVLTESCALIGLTMRECLQK